MTPNNPTIESLLDGLPAQLTGLSDTPGLDAQVLLAKVLDKPRTWVMAHPDFRAAPEQARALQAMVRRLKKGEPLPHVLGRWEFFGLELEITPAVLIPRPETELLVEHAIVWLQSRPQWRTIADIGTGSGAIALALAVHVPDAHITATDISAGALEVARRNAARLQVSSQVEFVRCDLLPAAGTAEAHLRRFDLICANLPYIPTETLRALRVYGREPTLALDGGPDGLEPFRRLLALAPERLAPGGLLLLEIESTRGSLALSLAYDAFEQAEIHLHQDLAGRDRLLQIQLSPSIVSGTGA